MEPKTKADQEKMSTALARLAAEDPSFRYHHTSMYFFIETWGWKKKEKKGTIYFYIIGVQTNNTVLIASTS